jgi:hypothetical protein
MRMHAIFASCLILAACSSEEQAPDAGEAETVGAVTPPVAEDVGQEIDPEDTAIADVIPSRFQGRWGMVGPDCEPGRADAKGLMEIGPDSLKFYESRAELDKITSVSANQMTAEFDFEGEGQEWERIVMLRLENDGETLIRTEAELDYPAEYTRC